MFFLGFTLFPLSKNCFGIINATKGYMQQTILDFDKEAIFLFGAFIMPFFFVGLDLLEKFSISLL